MIDRLLTSLALICSIVLTPTVSAGIPADTASTQTAQPARLAPHLQSFGKWVYRNKGTITLCAGACVGLALFLHRPTYPSHPPTPSPKPPTPAPTKHNHARIDIPPPTLPASLPPSSGPLGTPPSPDCSSSAPSSTSLVGSSPSPLFHGAPVLAEQLLPRPHKPPTTSAHARLLAARRGPGPTFGAIVPLPNLDSTTAAASSLLSVASIGSSIVLLSHSESGNHLAGLSDQNPAALDAIIKSKSVLVRVNIYSAPQDGTPTYLYSATYNRATGETTRL